MSSHGILLRSFLLLTTAQCFFLAACVSTSVAPPELYPATCSIDARFPGTWKSNRLSQIGPASMTFRFDCDCTVRSKARVLAMSIREEGAYWVENDSLSFTRASGEVTVWPFRFENDQLLLQEHEDEVYAYKRKAELRCP